MVKDLKKKKSLEQEDEFETPLEHLAFKVTQGIGSTTSLFVHTIFFVGIFGLYLFGVPTGAILLILTTVVSLEAIYLAIFLQLTVNRNTKSLQDVTEDIEEIAEDVDEIAEDVDEMEKDIDEIQEDVEGMEKDIDEIQEGIDEIQEEDEEEEDEEQKTRDALTKLTADLQLLLQDVDRLKRRNPGSAAGVKKDKK